MQEAEEKFGEYLKLKGLKFTPERRAILREVFSMHKHFDIETLYDRLKKRKERISLATIYRLIPLLVESGMVRQAVLCQGHVTYEHIYGHKHHDHMVCAKCGKVIEFSDDKLEKRQEEVCKKYNFQPIEHRLGIRGLCSKCRAD